MTAIRSAIHALESEIATSQARIAQLEAALKSLKPLGEYVEPAPKAKRSKPAVEVAVAAETMAVDAESANAAVEVVADAVPTEQPKKKRGRKAGSVTTFPKTGSEFFYSVMGASRKTMNDLIEGAARKLEVADEASIKILRARITSWLYPAIKSGYIVQAGEKNKLKAYQVAK